MQHQEINWQTVFQNVASITGLPLHLSRGKYYGACYITGEAHPRWDKLVVYLVKDGIRVMEQGGDNINLLKWLIEYGGCTDWASAYAHIRSGTSGYIDVKETRTWVEPPLKYVSDSEVGVRAGDCALRTFLSGKFGSERVQEVWDRYRVGSKVLRDGSVATVFWYLDAAGRCCHDKVMLYNEWGRRDKTYGGGRKYKVSDGYRGRTYFGSHLLRDWEGKIYVLESEKSCLICALHDPNGLYLATGGASMLRDVEKHWKILADADLAGASWVDRYPSQCIKWWERYDGVEQGMDIADIILRERANKFGS